MRFIVAGVKDGKSCVVQEIDCTPDPGKPVSVVRLCEQPVAAPPPRPAGKAMSVSIGVPAGMMSWLSVRFRANQRQPVHHTDSIDCLTVVQGSVELILDDGAHRLTVGDTALVRGVDHGWNTGPEGCTLSTVIIGTPAV
jgi:quercetin dioxygenase-like cupin family protein